MGNIFKFFLFTSILIILIGCEKQFMQISCDELLEQAYEESPLNNFEKNKFKDLFLNRYPEFDTMFEEAAQETGIEKNLLAAISFQESQWDPRAQSNMGVRGMMMVTLETAALVGVEKRLNPEFEGRFKVMLVPNITNICYGRGVGYKIEEIVLPEEIQKISATKIRAKMREDGDLK